MKVKRETLAVDAVVENIAEVTEFVNRQLEQWGCPEEIRAQIDIAIDEIFGNIARYAYGARIGKAMVQTEVTEEPLAVIIAFADGGVPFNPLTKEEPDLSLAAQERPNGGLGIYIVRQSMDEVFYEYREGKNILRIRKNF